jgi:predicted TIM-barrel fold metal-dependent hydrolase
MSDRFVIDGVCHPYNFSPANQRGRFGKLFTDVMYSYYPLVNPPDIAFSREEWEREWQCEEFIETMLLESDTDVCAVHTLPIYDAYEDGLTATDKGAQLKRDYPDRVLWYVGLDMFHPEAALDEVREAVAAGADGIKFYPSRYNEGRTEVWSLADEKIAFPVIQEAYDLGVRNVAIHKVLPIGPVSHRGQDVEDVSVAANVFPDMNFQVVHAGFMFVDETTFLLANHPNVYATMEASALLALLNPPQMQALIGAFMGFGGPHKVLYASAAVNPHPQVVIDLMENFAMPEGSPLQWNDEIKDLFMGGNLARLHGIDPAERRARLEQDTFSQWKRDNGGRRAPWSAIRSPVPA